MADDVAILRSLYQNSNPAMRAAPADISSVDYTPGFITRSVYVGGTGDLNVIMQDGTTVLFQSVPAGFVLPICVSKLLHASSTATKVVVLG